MSSSKRRLTGALASAAVALGALTPLTLGAATADAAPVSKPGKPEKPGKPGKPDKPGRYEQVQLLSFNDFHGNLEPPSGSSGRNITGYTGEIDPKTGLPLASTTDAGGAEYLATTLEKARKGHENSLTVAAGDLIGASPLLSAAFHDEPAVESMNKLGLDVSAVGNHEFDEGYQELQRMADGGCLDDGDGENNQDSCPAGTFRGADFDWLAANVRYAGTDETILPSYAVKKVGKAKIGFIGMTLEETPDIVTASGVAGLEFDDEVATANKLVPVLRKQGVNAIVVLIHQGGTPAPAKVGTNPKTGQPFSVAAPYDYTCGKGGSLEPSSPILPIARNLDPAIDMVVSGHTHNPYVCGVEDPAGQQRLVTSASSFGRLVTETNLTYDKATKDIVRASVTGTNLQVTRDQAADEAQSRLIAKYQELVKPIASRVLGSITADLAAKAPTGGTGESQLGDLIADAQLADDSVVTGGQVPQIAFMNPGGIRADLTYAKQSAGEDPGQVTYGEAFAVQPFNNFLVSLSLTGEQIYEVLAQQGTGNSQKVLQVSDGFQYRLGTNGPVAGSATLNGTPIDTAKTYRVVTNNFLADGGDGFAAFKKGTGVYYGGLDIDAFADYLQAESPYSPEPFDRILPAG